MVGRRGPYERISAESRHLLITAFQQKDNWLALAAQLGIKRQTARSIISNWERSGRVEAQARGGSRGRSLTSNQVEAVVRWTKAEPRITLSALRSKLIEECPGWQPCALQTISRAISDEFISFTKRRALLPSHGLPNSSLTKALRHDYAEWLLTEGVRRNLVFCAEVECHLCPVKKEEAGDNPHLVFCAAVSPKWGLVHWRFLHEEHFGYFLVEVATLVNKEFVLLCEDASGHEMPALNSGQELRTLPPESAFLNVAESAIESVRASLKQRFQSANEEDGFRINFNPEKLQVGLKEFRERVMRECVEQEVALITAEMCENWFNGTLRFLPKCLKLVDIGP